MINFLFENDQLMMLMADQKKKYVERKKKKKSAHVSIFSSLIRMSNPFSVIALILNFFLIVDIRNGFDEVCSYYTDRLNKYLSNRKETYY